MEGPRRMLQSRRSRFPRTGRGRTNRNGTCCHDKAPSRETVPSQTATSRNPEFRTQPFPKDSYRAFKSGLVSENDPR
jgi:hypothetical protein